MKNPTDISFELKNIKKSKVINEIYAKKVEGKLELELIKCLNMAVNNIEDEIICKQFKLDIA